MGRNLRRGALNLQSVQGSIEEIAKEKIKSRIREAKKEKIPVMDEFEVYALERLRVQNYVCELTGWPFDVVLSTPGAGRRQLAPSPDRIDPSRGYVRGNVRWVFWCLNRGKGTMDDVLFVRVCAAVADRARAQGLIPFMME